MKQSSFPSSTALLIFVALLLSVAVSPAVWSEDSAPAAESETKPATETKQQDAPSEPIEKPAKEEVKAQQKIIDEAIKDFDVFDGDGNKIRCSKEDLIASEVDGKVSYRCRSEEQALGESKDLQDGEGETNQLIDSLLLDSKQTYDAQEIQLNDQQIEAIEQATKKTEDKEAIVDEPKEKAPAQDVLIIEQTEEGELKVKGAEVTEEPKEVKAKPTEEKAATEDSEEKEEDEEAWYENLPLKPYLSMRFENSTVVPGNSFRDGGSRGGLLFAKQLESGDRLIAHYEFGSNIFDLVNPAQEKFHNVAAEFYKRLEYLRYGQDSYYVVIGKNWSVYNYIAEMTDKFNSVGGDAMASYGDGEDGGALGTGRADSALQIRSSRGILQWGMQLQSENKIPGFKDVKYELNAAMMFKFKFLNGLGIGMSFIRAVPNDITDEMISRGFDSSSEGAILGIEFEASDWLFASTFTRHRNMVQDDLGIYYDAYGSEVYASTNITPRFQFRTGLGYQAPRNNTRYEGEHRIQQYYLSFEYRYNNNLLDKIFAELIYDNGRDARGDARDNELILGFRYNL